MANANVIVFVFSTLFFVLAVSATRKISTDFNRCNWNKTCSDLAIGHIRAVGSTDVLHYLVSPIGLPTVFVAKTGKDVLVTVDWSGLLSDKATLRAEAVKFHPPEHVLYTYAVVFTKLIDYNDTGDHADMTKYDLTPENSNTYSMDEFSWTSLPNVSDAAGNTIVLTAAYDKLPALWQNNGTFSIQLKAFADDGREGQLPHMQYSENITQFDVNIDHVWTNNSKSRFAMELAVIGQDGEEMTVDTTESIDDEYSPGVFILYNWLTRKHHSSETGFLQWKPVCYKSLVRARNQATGMKHYGLVDVDSATEGLLNHSIVYGIYGEQLPNIMMKLQNFSFGLSQDGGYNKSHVLTWSASIGYGTPPVDSVSTLVYIIITTGLGIPVLFIIFGGIFVVVKKRNAKPDKVLHDIHRNGDYQAIPQSTPADES